MIKLLLLEKRFFSIENKKERSCKIIFYYRNKENNWAFYLKGKRSILFLRQQTNKKAKINLFYFILFIVDKKFLNN